MPWRESISGVASCYVLYRNCSFSSSRLLLLLLLLLLLRLKLLCLPFLVKPSDLPLHLVLLHNKVVARDLELRDDFFRRGFLVAFALLECVSKCVVYSGAGGSSRRWDCVTSNRKEEMVTTYLFNFLIGLQSSAVDCSGDGDGSDRAGHDPSADGLDLWCGHITGDREGMSERDVWPRQGQAIRDQNGVRWEKYRPFAKAVSPRESQRVPRSFC